MKINLSEHQIRLFVALIHKEREQWEKTPYHPLVEFLCLYQKEIIAKRMVFCIREQFSKNAANFMSNIAKTQYFDKEASVFRSAINCTIPFVNTGAFYILSQYALFHGNLTTGFDEIFRGLVYRTQTICIENLIKSGYKQKFKLSMELPDVFYSQNLVRWWPDYYPRIFFINSDGTKKEPTSDMEKQILLGLNSPIVECAPDSEKTVFAWTWKECVLAMELISSTQAIARLAYAFPGWNIEQSDEVMAKHLYRLRVEQRNMYKHAMRAFHRSIYTNMPSKCKLTHSFIYRISAVKYKS
jgi:hypothetical protein